MQASLHSVVPLGVQCLSLGHCTALPPGPRLLCDLGAYSLVRLDLDACNLTDACLETAMNNLFCQHQNHGASPHPTTPHHTPLHHTTTHDTTTSLTGANWSCLPNGADSTGTGTNGTNETDAIDETNETNETIGTSGMGCKPECLPEPSRHLKPYRASLLPSLECLSISATLGLSSVGIGTLVALLGEEGALLRDLNLAGCVGVGDDAMAAFRTSRRLRGLERLNVCSCPSISDAGIQQLRGLERLCEVQITGSAATQAGLGCLADSRTMRALYFARKQKGLHQESTICPLESSPLLMPATRRKPRRLGTSSLPSSPTGFGLI